jgi:hypothetical protein
MTTTSRKASNTTMATQERYLSFCWCPSWASAAREDGAGDDDEPEDEQHEKL